jgi:PAS domain S-box-containing protein
MIDLKKYLSPPVFDDEIKTQQAYMLNVILWTLVCVPIPFAIYTFIFTPESSTRAILQIVFGETVNIALLVMLHRGYVQEASILQTGAFWFFFTATALTGSGVQGEAYLLGYGLVIAIAGILLGGRGAAFFTALSIIAGGWMAYHQTQIGTTAGYESSPLTTWIVSLVLFPVITALQYLSSRTLRITLARANANEEKYRLISQVSMDYIFSSEVNKEGVSNISWVAGAFEKMTGYTFEEYIAAGGWSAHLHPDDLEKDAQDMELLHKNQDVKTEVRTFTKNGEVRWEHVFAHPIWDDKENTLVGIVGAVQDITEQKRIENTLVYERDLLQIFLDNIPDTVYFKDDQSRFVRINQAQARFLGLNNPQDAIGKTDFDFQNHELAQQFMQEEKQILETGQPILNRIELNPTADGNPRWIAATKVPVRDASGQIIGTIGISRNITEQKEAQEKLEKIFLQQAAILNNIPDMAWLKDRESRYIAVNEVFVKASGMKVEDIIGKSDFDIWQKSFAEIYRSDDIEVMQSGLRKNTEEIQVDSSGREYWIETTKTPILGQNGDVIGTTGIAREITERKMAQEAELRRRTMLEKVIQLGKQVTELADLHSTITKIWHGIHDDLGFDRLAIFLFNPETGSMDDTVGTNNAGELVELWNISFPVGATFSAVLQSPDGMYFTRNYDIENNIPEDHEMYGVKDYVAVAAWAGNKPVAVICADHGITHHPIAPEQLEALRLFGGYAGLAIENARLNETIQKELAEEVLSQERESRRRAILEKVIRLSQRVTETHDIRTTLTRIWHSVREDLGFDRIGIYIYNPERNSMDGTFGTSNQGEMLDEWHTWVSLEEDKRESKLFLRVLENPDSIYFTHSYAEENQTPQEHIMSNVKDFAAIAAWSGSKPVAVIGVDNQISGRLITEEQLEALRFFAGYAGLAIENARLYSALQDELAQRKNFILELEAKNAELERFTYTVSHDLKSPLVTIRGFIGYLERDAKTGDFEKFRRDVQRIETAVEKMQNLLKDLLELSRIGRLINEPVEISFNQLIEETIETLDGQIKANRVSIEFENIDVFIKCDHVRMLEVTQNLIENAIKFMGTQPNPIIRIGSYEDDKNRTVFYIKDNGIGIATEFQENIFGLFNKLSSDSEGTGIGLALVKRIIEVHGGQIWVESQVGHGTTFYFTLA